MAGLVFVDGQRVDKAGTKICVDSDITLKEKLKYVSRGGLKLEKAVDSFDINFKDKKVIDIGASTGGFTDVALQNGASFVFAVDSGKNQLHEKMKMDERVADMEKTNFRTIEFQDIGEKVPVMVCDVSFISLLPIIDSLIQFCEDGADVILLIKPQFEAEKKEVGKNGVVRDMTVHERVIKKVIEHAHSKELSLFGLTASPIKGPKGNIEYLVYFRYNMTACECDYDEIIRQVVNEHSCYSC